MEKKIIAGISATVVAGLVIVLIRSVGLFKYPLAGFGAAFVAWTATYAALSTKKDNNKKEDKK